MLDKVTWNFEKVYSILTKFYNILMFYEVLIQMHFCYDLFYFIEILILFLIVNLIRCHCSYFYAHNWFDHLDL